MQITINIKKNHMIVFSVLVSLLGLLILTTATPFTQFMPWHALQQITKTEAGATSIDANNDGVIDDAEVAEEVDWTGITNIPADIADGDATGIGAETDPTVLASVKDGVSWGEVTGIPADIADGDDDSVTVESDPTVLASVKDGVAWTEVTGIPADIADGDAGTSGASDYLYMNTDAYFRRDIANRIRTPDSFYVDGNSPGTYLYSTNTYLGATSGDATHIRGNTLDGTNFRVLNGEVRASTYCDESGANCKDASAGTGGTLSCTTTTCSHPTWWCSVACPAGYTVTGGGGNPNTNGDLILSLPSGNGWQCGMANGGTCYARCCNIA